MEKKKKKTKGKSNEREQLQIHCPRLNNTLCYTAKKRKNHVFSTLRLFFHSLLLLSLRLQRNLFFPFYTLLNFHVCRHIILSHCEVLRNKDHVCVTVTTLSCSIIKIIDQKSGLQILQTTSTKMIQKELLLDLTSRIEYNAN